ncbi:MAG: GNAT family N-acetyltransferase [Promethearchaeota archaeon]|jgi:predicted acetyltransferase
MKGNLKIQKLTEEDRESFRKLIRIAFDPTYNSYENMDDYISDDSMDLFYGAFDEELLVSGLGIHPYEIRMRSQDFKMLGIGWVATKPEYRNRGIVRELMLKQFEYMHENNIPISVLFPAKPSFYERLGYKLVDELVYYHFKISDIKHQETNYHMVEVEIINDDIRRVYDKNMFNYDYIAKRPDIDYWKRHARHNYKFICYNENQPVGYVFINFPSASAFIGSDVWVEHPDKTIVIREAFWLDPTAKQTIFNFLWTYSDQREYIAGVFPVNEVIIDLLKTPRILKRKIIDNSFLRIIDVKSVLENLEYPIDDFSISFEIHDEFCLWNNGVFKLKSERKNVSVEFKKTSEIPVDIDIDISYFGQLVTGFRTIMELSDLGFVSINQGYIELLQNLFPRSNSCFFEYF